jgi:hypothetical protein
MALSGAGRRRGYMNWKVEKRSREGKRWGAWRRD